VRHPRPVDGMPLISLVVFPPANKGFFGKGQGTRFLRGTQVGVFHMANPFLFLHQTIKLIFTALGPLARPRIPHSIPLPPRRLSILRPRAAAFQVTVPVERRVEVERIVEVPVIKVVEKIVQVPRPLTPECRSDLWTSLLQQPGPRLLGLNKDHNPIRTLVKHLFPAKTKFQI